MKVALLAAHPASVPELSLDNYGAHRIAASLEADPDFEGVVHVVEVQQGQSEAALHATERLDPDVVGVSAFLWSLPTLYPVARELKQRRPERRLFLGGPSARPEMFERSPWNDAPTFVDALVIGPGDWTIRELVSAERADYGRIGGLALPDGDRFARTAPRAGDPALDLVASPYQSGRLTPSFPVLQTYFGCPLDCAFCAWGALGNARDVLSTDSLIRELSVWKGGPARGALMCDAALNLNEHAFQNLAAAEAQVGFFRDQTLLCELYPDRLTPDHLRFLSSIRRPQVSVGLQSYDPDVLARVRRQFDEQRFHTVLEELLQVADVVIEIICGLPGDDPDSFRRTFERVRELPYGCRVYPCLALPDALMADPAARRHTTWDPVSLEVTSTWGWSQRALDETRAFVEDECRRAGGYVADYWWSFDKRAQPARPDRIVGTGATGAELVREIARLTNARWHVVGLAPRDGRELHLSVRCGPTTFSVWCERPRPDQQYYRIVDGVGFNYENDAMPRGELHVFEQVFGALAAAFGALFGSA